MDAVRVASTVALQTRFKRTFFIVSVKLLGQSDELSYGIVQHSHVSFKFHVTHPPFNFPSPGLLFDFLAFFRLAAQTHSIPAGTSKLVWFPHYFLRKYNMKSKPNQNGWPNSSTRAKLFFFSQTFLWHPVRYSRSFRHLPQSFHVSLIIIFYSNCPSFSERTIVI